MQIGRKLVRVNPKELKKRSDYAVSTAFVETKGLLQTVSQPDTLKPVENGFKSTVFLGKGFESYRLVLSPNHIGDKVWHGTKDKLIHVLSGRGFLYTKTYEDESTRILNTGDFVELKAGTTYGFRTASETLDLFVTQSAKYDDKLEIIEKIEQVTAVSTPSTPSTRKRASKAVEQQLIKASQKKENVATAVLPNGKRAKAVPPERMAQAAGVNAMPSGGNFSDDNAG